MKNIITKTITLILLLGISVLWAPVVSHAAPNLVNYQGVLEDSGGTPVPDANYDMVFRVYDAATAGILLWEEGQTVATVNGIYNVLLGSGTPIFGSFDPGLFSNDNLWLEVEVSTEVLAPRQQVTSVAFALRAEEANNAATLEGMSASSLDQSAHVIDTSNPHAVTPTGIGAASTTDLNAHTGNTSNPHNVTAGQTGAATAGDIIAHSLDSSAHHTPYADAQAVIAMGAVGDGNTLNHNKYADADAQLAMGANLNSNPYNHDRYTFLEAMASARAALGNQYCPPGQAVTGIDSNGDINCEGVSRSGPYTDSESGRCTSEPDIAIGSDGLPIIACEDSGDLIVIHCYDQGCVDQVNAIVTRYTVNIATPRPDISDAIAIGIGVDGLPIIGFIDDSSQALKVMHCDNLQCTTGVINQVDDPDYNEVLHVSLAIGHDYLPIFSIIERGSVPEVIRTVHCGNVSCSSAGSNTFATLSLGNFGDISRYTEIAISTDGFPIVSFFNQGEFSKVLKVTRCATYDCSDLTPSIANVAYQFLGNPNPEDLKIDMALDSNGFPMFILNEGDGPEPGLKLLQCSDKVCANVFNTVLIANTSVEKTSLIMGSDGLPLIIYKGGASIFLRTVHCSTFTCNAQVGYDFNDIADPLSMAAVRGADGVPLILHKVTGDFLRVVHCADVLCTPE